MDDDDGLIQPVTRFLFEFMRKAPGAASASVWLFLHKGSSFGVSGNVSMLLGECWRTGWRRGCGWTQALAEQVHHPHGQSEHKRALPLHLVKASCPCKLPDTSLPSSSPPALLLQITPLALHFFSPPAYQVHAFHSLLSEGIKMRAGENAALSFPPFFVRKDMKLDIHEHKWRLNCFSTFKVCIFYLEISSKDN